MATRILKIVKPTEKTQERMQDVTIGSRLVLPTDVFPGDKVLEVVNVDMIDCSNCRQKLGMNYVLQQGYHLIDCRDCGLVWYHIR